MRKALTAILAATLPGIAVASDWSLGSSMSSGRYGGTQATRVASSSIGLRSSLSGWNVSATLPYLRIRSSDDLVIAGGVVASNQSGDRSGNRSGARPLDGYGDLQLRVDRSIASVGRMPFDARITAQLKAPTGARSLSTGKADGGLGIELSRQLGKITPYVSAGYRIYGDSPGFRLKNGWSTSAGATFALGSMTLMASYERSHALYFGPAPRELFGLASYPVTPNWNWSVYGSKGLNAGSADLMVGTALTRRIF